MPRYIQGLSFLLFVFVFPGATFAAAPLSCDQSAALRPRVKDCEDNLVYANAGKACLEVYEKAIVAARVKVAESLQAVVSSDAQNAGLENAKKGYGLAIDSLKALVKQGRVFEKEVANYKNEVVLPEDFGSATEAGLPAETFLRNQPCYTESQKLIKQHARNIGLSARQLELTAEISEELAKKAFRGESSLKNKNLLPMLEPKPGKNQPSPAPLPAPKDKSGKSDITGTDKDKKTKPNTDQKK